MAHNYPKWPKNDARFYALFPQFFFAEKAVSQTFSLLECMDAVETRSTPSYGPADASGSIEEEELLRQAIALSLMAEPDEEELLRQAIRISRSSLSDPN